MSDSSVSRPGTRPPGVRQQYSASTKRALVDAAERLFTENGYAATSLDAVVAGAQVTKGALYHHFSGKQAVFEAVFERVESECARAVADAVRDEEDPWQKARTGLRAFLDGVREPRFRRIVIQDGPAVLGYQHYRDKEERSAYGVVLDIVRAVVDAGPWDFDEAMVQTFARIFFGAMSSAGEAVSSAQDPAAAAADVETAIGFILAGFQALADSGDAARYLE